MTFNFNFHSHNVYLFAYYLSERTDSLGEYQTDWLWKKCDGIVAKTLNPQFQFNIKENLDLENQPEEPWANINKHFLKTDDYHPLYIQPHKLFLDESKIDPEGKSVTIYPVQLYDSYGFGLKLITPHNDNDKAFGCADIALVNPNNCLMLDVNKENKYFLGQTLLIPIHLEGSEQLKLKCKVDRDKLKRSDREKLTRIAENYIDSLLPDEVRKPQFNGSGHLFGSPIFEYGIIRASRSYNHILIWFIVDEESEAKFDKYYQQILDLFYFRAKIIHAYEQIRKIEKKAKNKSKSLQLKIKKSQEDCHENKDSEGEEKTHELDLDILQTLLMELPEFSVEHTDNLRVIKELQNIIIDNTKNYADKIYEIESNFVDENFSFLELFIERVCQPFQDRVNAAVNFFQLDTHLINNAIDSIRGQVAIEQARRERQLQANITSLGIGIAVAGNWASSYEAGSITEKDAPYSIQIGVPYDDNSPINSALHVPHFIISFTTSMFVGFIVWRAALMFFNWRYKQEQLIRDKQEQRIKENKFQ